MTFAFFLILSFYCALVTAIIWGWLRVMKKNPGKSGPPPHISIIVPFRNEVGNMEHLIKSFMSLNYPRDHWEVILVNDHSTDLSVEMAQSVIGGYENFLIHNLDAHQQGKKQALQAGIQLAKFKIIATTDADCTVPFGWLKSIGESFQNENTRLSIGFVKLGKTASLFGRIQAIELTSLMASTAAAVGWGHPIMCNGANLAFRKETFFEVGEYHDHINIASGDDEFLMRKIKNRFHDSVTIHSSQDAVVVTQEQETVGGFINQRIRWAGKWKHNSDRFTQVLALIVLASHISFVGLLLLLPVGSPMLLLAIAKIFLEGMLIRKASAHLRHRFDWFGFLLLQVIYPFYVLLIGLSSFFVAPRWKNRKL